MKCLFKFKIVGHSLYLKSMISLQNHLGLVFFLLLVFLINRYQLNYYFIIYFNLQSLKLFWRFCQPYWQLLHSINNYSIEQFQLICLTLNLIRLIFLYRFLLENQKINLVLILLCLFLGKMASLPMFHQISIGYFLLKQKAEINN